jgi:hypothetical protein
LRRACRQAWWTIDDDNIKRVLDALSLQDFGKIVAHVFELQNLTHKQVNKELSRVLAPARPRLQQPLDDKPMIRLGEVIVGGNDSKVRL